MKVIVSALILVTLVTGEHSGPAKRAILGQGYGKIEVESIGKSIELHPNLSTQNSLYLSPPIKALPIQEANIEQLNINHLVPPYPSKAPENLVQSYQQPDQRYNSPNDLPASNYNAEGYLPPAENDRQISQPQLQHYQNQPFTSVKPLENQPTYKDYIARTHTPESQEKYYKAPGYLPPRYNSPSLKLNPVSESSFPQSSQSNAAGYLPPSSNSNIVFPQSKLTHGTAGYLPPTSHSIGQSTTHLLPVKNNFQTHDYSAPDYLPPNNQPLTPQNAHLEVQPNIYGDANPVYPPKPIQSFPSSPQTHSNPQFLNHQSGSQQKDQTDESYSAPGYLPPQGNAQADHGFTQPLDHQHQTDSAAGYLPPNQSGNSDPTDIDVRVSGDDNPQTGINEHSGYDYAKPQGPAFHEGQPESNIQTQMRDENHISYQKTDQSHNVQNSLANYQSFPNSASSEQHQIQTIKIIRENPNGKQESIRTIQIIAEKDNSNAIRTIKILQNSQPEDNVKTIKFIDYSATSNNNYLPPQRPQQLINQNSANLPSSDQHLHLQSNSLPISSSSVQATSASLSTSSNNGYLPPSQIVTNNYSPNTHTSQQVHNPNLQNIPSPSLHSPISNNGYLPPNNQPLSLISNPNTPISNNNFNPSYEPSYGNPTANTYLPPTRPLQSLQTPQVEIIKIISENNHNGADPAIYASVAAANLKNINTIQILNGRSVANSRRYGESDNGYSKTRLIRFYRRF